MENKVSFVNVMKFAGAYCACAIGSGFATGQEIMQFFTAEGIMSILGAVITMGVFGWVGGTAMKHAKDLNLILPDSIVQYYFSEKLGKVFGIIVQLFLFAVFVIMIAGSGATLAEYYGINPYVGRIGMIVVSLISVLLNLNKLVDILGSMGIVIIILAVSVGLISFFKNAGALSTAAEIIPTLDMTRASGNWLFSAILYPGFNGIVVLIFSAGIGMTANSGKEAMCGGLVGGILFGLAVLCMNLGLMVNVTEVWDKQIPSLVLASNIFPVLGTIFSVIIIIGIYTTAVPMLWTSAGLFGKQGSKSYVIAAVVLSIVAFILGLTDFDVLVNTIYPFSGYIGILMMVIMLWRCLFDKRDKTEVGKALNEAAAKKASKQ